MRVGQAAQVQTTVAGEVHTALLKVLGGADLLIAAVEVRHMLQSNGVLRLSVHLPLVLLVWVLLSPFRADADSGPAGGSAVSDAPPASLRIEVGMHTAPIRAISSDLAGRILATASDDKTVRIWDAKFGRLLRTLRVPLGGGNIGKVYAVALSPDGTRLVCGGYLAPSGQTSTLYLMDVETGRILASHGLPGTVFYLAWSRDGQRIALSLGSSGVQLLDAGRLTPLHADTDFQDRSHGIAFSPDGTRLAATGLDGFVRLYDASLKRLQKVKAPAGDQPFRITFSPDGQRLLVGYNDVPRASVLDPRSLHPLARLEAPEPQNGNLVSVAWSQEGLLAGGTYPHQGEYPILRWREDALSNPPERLPAGDSTVLDLLALPAGLAWASADPAWGRIGSPGQGQVRLGPQTGDFRGEGEHFRLSADGTRVDFGMKYAGTSPVRFDFRALSLEADPIPDPTLLSPVTQGRIPVEGWEDTRTPTRQGQPIELKPYERSRALAFAPDRQGFLLGTSSSLRYVAPSGATEWKRSTPGEAWAVQLSQDGRLAVAAFGDGTVRWYRADDGTELVALYVHPDRQRWVAFTPSGTFASSPGADNLIGWTVPQPASADGVPTAPRWVTGDSLRKSKARPGILRTVLITLNEAVARQSDDALLGVVSPPVSSLAASLPPELRLLAPQPLSEVGAQVTLTYQLECAATAPCVDPPEVRVDGQRVPAQVVSDRGLEVMSTPRPQLQVVLPPPAADLTVKAGYWERRLTLVSRNAHGSASQEVVVRQKVDPTVPSRGVMRILAVGYNGLGLNYAEADVLALANALKRGASPLYTEVQIKTLLGQDATREEILSARTFLSGATSFDTSVLILSGHGDAEEGSYYFLNAGADPKNLTATALEFEKLAKMLSNLPGRRILFLDTCHAGAMSGLDKNLVAMRGASSNLDQVLADLQGSGGGVYWLMASTSAQQSQERSELQHGVFTWAALQVLADVGQEPLSLHALYIKIHALVQRETQRAQTPTFKSPDGAPDFPLVVKPGK